MQVADCVGVLGIFAPHCGLVHAFCYEGADIS